MRSTKNSSSLKWPLTEEKDNAQGPDPGKTGLRFPTTPSLPNELKASWLLSKAGEQRFIILSVSGLDATTWDRRCVGYAIMNPPGNNIFLPFLANFHIYFLPNCYCWFF